MYFHCILHYAEVRETESWRDCEHMGKILDEAKFYSPTNKRMELN